MPGSGQFLVIHQSGEGVRELGVCNEADLLYVSAKFADVPSRKAFEAADGLRLNEVSFLENLALRRAEHGVRPLLLGH